MLKVYYSLPYQSKKSMLDLVNPIGVYLYDLYMYVNNKSGEQKA